MKTAGAFCSFEEPSGDPSGYPEVIFSTVGTFWSGEESYGDPSSDPEEISSSEGSEDPETSPDVVQA